MAERIESDVLFLKPCRFGTATWAVPMQGFNGPTQNAHDAAKSPIGTVVSIRCDGANGAEGYAELVYLQAAEALAPKQLCTSVYTPFWYQFGSAEASQANVLAVVCAGRLDAKAFGWFWCGGICPVAVMAALRGGYERTECLDSIRQFF